MVDPADPLALSGYQLRLPSFEGPLDVLLRLIEREQLAIADVSLVAVTDQFLAHLAAMEAARPAEIAAFSAVAARLLVLKSRSLLPRPPAVDADERDDDLVHQLREHQALKTALAELADRDRIGGQFFPRGAAVATVLESTPPRLAPGPPAALARALRRRLTLLAPAPLDLPARRVVSLPRTVARVLELLVARSRVRFSEVIGDRPDREETLVAFLAVLVLLRRRQVEADQAEPFGEIDLVLLNPNRDLVAAGTTETGFA